MMDLRVKLGNSYVFCVLAITCLYLGFEIFFNYYATFAVDEFWFAHNIYAFKSQLPYRDFPPYKTVLGYYILLLPLLVKSGTIDSIIFVKNCIAVLNSILIIFTAFHLTKYFSRKSIFASLVLLLSADLMLSYSTNLRVDLLGYWFGFFALLYLLEKRFLIAGILLGVGFLITQKVIWYFAAANGALCLYSVLFQRDWHSFKNICILNLSATIVIFLYLLFWSAIASFSIVIENVFYDAMIMYHMDWYDSARLLFWKLQTLHNPVLFLLWPITLLSIIVGYENDKTYRQRFIIVVFSLIILACLIPYKQVFPYYFQVTIPILLVLYAAFFSWLLEIFSGAKPRIYVHANLICIYLGFYIAAIIWLSVKFQYPPIYLSICLVPMVIIAYLNNTETTSPAIRNLNFNLICVTIILVNTLYPLMLFSIKMVDLNGNYQKTNVNLINSLLKDGSDYVAGIELIYNKTQPISGMRHLMGPAVDFLSQPTDKLRSYMLASLNEDPNASINSVISDWKKSNVKFYVNNYRMVELPEKIKDYLDSQYEHFWGSIYVYAPLIKASQNKIHIKFSGKYQIQSNQCVTVEINGKKYSRNTAIYLEKGSYSSKSDHFYRLKLLPDGLPFVRNQDYAQDRWEKMLS